MMASSASMRDVGQRLLIGLAATAAVVMGIGYAFIAGNIAAPIGGDLGTFDVPPEGTAAAVLLDDGAPAFIVSPPGGALLAIDARAPVATGTPGRLVGWCADGRYFLDAVDGATYDADGSRLAGAEPGPGLVAHPTRRADDGRVTVSAEERPAGARDDLTAPTSCLGAVVHRARPDEVFDPSVAVEQEPPGWIWLEGRLEAVDGEVRLCDGLDGRCETYARVAGIDPALANEPALAGSFFARVRDDAIADLQYVPHPGGTR